MVYDRSASYKHDFLHFYKGHSIFSNKLSMNSYFLMIKKERKDIRFRGDISNINGLKIGFMRGYNLIDLGKLEDILEDLDVLETDSQKQLEKLLLIGKIDAAIVPLGFFHLYKNGQLKNFKVLSRPVVVDYVHLAFSKKTISMDFVVKFSDELLSYQNTSAHIKRLQFYNRLRGLPRNNESGD